MLGGDSIKLGRFPDITTLINHLLATLSAWGRENLKEFGWIVSDPHSYEWWGDFKDPFEISVSAILVQLSRWEVVSSAINKLRKNGLLNPHALAEAPIEKIEELTRGVGFRKSKAKTLKEFSQLIIRHGGWGTFMDRDLIKVREDLLRVRGIGYETADTMLLFAGNKLVLPVSRLTKRVLARVGIELPSDYVRAQRILEESIPSSLSAYKLFHAGLVSISKRYCKVKKPLCCECPLNHLCNSFKQHQVLSQTRGVKNT